MCEEAISNDLHLAVGGDADALQRLLVDYHGPLLAALRGAMPPNLKQRLEPEDVLQEAYTSAFRALMDADGPAPLAFSSNRQFYKWLESIALNRLKDEQRAQHTMKRDIRREARVPAAATDSYPNLWHHVQGRDPTPSRALAREEAVAAVMTSLARLPHDQQLVLRRRFLQNVAFEDIAQELNKSCDAVYMICHRGLRGLRKRLVSISWFLTTR